MIFCAISWLMAIRDSFTLTMTLPLIVLMTDTTPPTTKPRFLQMLFDFRLSADSLDDVFLAGIRNRKRHGEHLLFLNF